MEKPNPDDKKYHYFHKGAGKKMFNNELFSKDFKAWKAEQEKLKDKEI